MFRIYVSKGEVFAFFFCDIACVERISFEKYSVNNGTEIELKLNKPHIPSAEYTVMSHKPADKRTDRQTSINIILCSHALAAALYGIFYTHHPYYVLSLPTFELMFLYSFQYKNITKLFLLSCGKCCKFSILNFI